MSDIEEIPPVLLKRHPELVAVGEALQQYGRGERVTARCERCQLPLDVVEVAETGALVVTCPGKHVSFRARRAKGS